MSTKTGTVTFHNSYNYGSVLQAYALQRVQELNGYDNEIINYIYDYDMRQYKIFRTYLYKNNPKSLISDLIFLYKNLSRRKKYKEFQRKNLKMTKQEFHSSDEITKIVHQYDAFICGSDQIWNSSCTKKVVPAYFLQFAKNTSKRKIAYAPSVAHAIVEEQYKDEFKSKLKNLDSISVRETSSVNLIKEVSEKEVVQVLDPTLLLDMTEYEKIMEPIQSPREYILFYSLEKNHEMFEYVKRLSKKMNLNVIYFSKKNILSFRKGLNMYSYGPGEFLYLLRNAKYIVTNSFHATAFSVIFKKKFVTFTTARSYPRMVDFLSLIDLQNRIYTKSINIDDDINYSKVMEVLNREKKRSLIYLISNLEKCKGEQKNDMQ